MTFLSRLFLFYPALVLALALSSLIWFITAPNPWAALCFVASLYLFPLLCYRIHHLIFPLKEGVSYLVNRGYSPWWGGHQIQWIYLAFPMLEVVLRLIPGLFSLWLRLWGSQIGRSVYWTPMFEIADRGLLELGDGVVVGHRVGIYPHVIKPKDDNLMLYVRRVRIGTGAFIGAGSEMGPGVRVSEGSMVKVRSQLYPGKKVS